MIRNFISKLFKKEEEPQEAMSFSASMDLCDLPICTFYQGERKLNFLLDTGANNSVINKDALKFIKNTPLQTEKQEYIYGVEGHKSPITYCGITLTYKSKNYDDVFVVQDLTKAFLNVKQEYGVTLHGLLGSKFFQKYQYILDFQSLIAYNKHKE